MGSLVTPPQGECAEILVLVHFQLSQGGFVRGAADVVLIVANESVGQAVPGFDLLLI